MVKKKDSDKIAVPVPDAKTPPGIPVDEYHGLGGSYVIDPATGKRTRVDGPNVGADGIHPGTATETTEEEKADEIE